MDAFFPGDVTRAVDYKYTTWNEGAEHHYETQMTAYSLALMKALAADRAGAELWYLKSPMKIVRREYTRREAENRLRDLFFRYLAALETDDWPTAERQCCHRIQCGFRSRCW